MLPLGHAALGVLLYLLLEVGTRRRLRVGGAILFVLLGTQLPDLIDKPAVFYGLVSSGRAVGHSLLGVGVVCGGVALLTWVSRDRLAVVDRLFRGRPYPLTVGYVSHLLGDSHAALLAGQWSKLTYLLWPVLAPPQYPKDDIAPWVRLERIYLEGGLHPQWWLILLAIASYVVSVVWSRSRRAAPPAE